MIRFITLAYLSLAVLEALPTAALADVYKCLDRQNKVFYQDRPCQELTSAQLPPALSRSATDDSRPHFLWKAASAKGTVYLMGALPFGANEMYPLPEAVTDALSGSDVLVVGADIRALSPAELLAATANLGVYPDNSNLKNRIKAATWEKVITLSGALGMAEETISARKPWMASLSLMALAAQRAGYTQELSVDKAFVKETQTQKPVLQLDSINEQAKVLDGLSEIEQEQILLQSINEIERGDDYFKSMAEAWARGDSSNLELIVRRRFETLPAMRKLFKLLFTDRSAVMAQKIEELAGDGRTYFVVLEAGHLVGEHGLLNLLQSRGYKLSQL
ncbi:TraB/GumN family protein [Methylocaldum sp. MU1018]